MDGDAVLAKGALKTRTLKRGIQVNQDLPLEPTGTIAISITALDFGKIGMFRYFIEAATHFPYGRKRQQKFSSVKFSSNSAHRISLDKPSEHHEIASPLPDKHSFLRTTNEDHHGDSRRKRIRDYKEHEIKRDLPAIASGTYGIVYKGTVKVCHSWPISNAMDV